MTRTTPDAVTEAAHAKINLWLEVTGTRPDGYHTLRSVMQTVSLQDTLYIERTDAPLSMTCNDGGLSVGEDNLCMKAARLFCRTLRTDPHFGIRLDKRIPSGAGLGGGSADAAAVLRGLNRLCGEPFSPDGLRRMAVRLGADVPFLVEGGIRLCEGIGELLSPFPSLPDLPVLLCRGREKVATPAAYRLLDETEETKHPSFSAFVRAAEEGNIAALAVTLYNRFEDISPSAVPLRKALRENGALAARLSGSGSAVFGIFPGMREAERAFCALTKAGISCALTGWA